MSDQCRHCTNTGDSDACGSVKCHIHDSWYVKQLKEDLAEKQSLLDLQHKRTLIADELWKKETGKDCFPDLGDLIDWLMEKANLNNEPLADGEECTACGYRRSKKNLTLEQRAEIRKLRASGAMVKDLASQFNKDTSTIWRVVNEQPVEE